MQWEELSQVRSMWQCAHCTTWVLPAPHDGTNRVLDVLDAKAGRGEGCPNGWGEEANAAPPIVKRTAKAVFPRGYGLAALAAAYEHVPSTVISLPVFGESQWMRILSWGCPRIPSLYLWSFPKESPNLRAAQGSGGSARHPLAGGE